MGTNILSTTAICLTTGVLVVEWLVLGSVVDVPLDRGGESEMINLKLKLELTLV
jgi:hypothetical protein